MVPLIKLQFRAEGRVSVTEEQRRLELIKPSWGFPTTRHMQVLDLHISTFTQILQNVNRSALPESTVLHRPSANLDASISDP
jgi:hypothetical protein